MDDPRISDAEMHPTLRELTTINRLLGGYGPSIRGLKRLVPRDSKRCTLLDVGCGAGDVTRAMVRWGELRNMHVEATGIDLQPSVVSYAREVNQTNGSPIQYRQASILDLEETERFDIVHASLLLHHFGNEEVRQVLRKMYAASRWGVVINDLHRHPLAYFSIRVLTRMLSSSPLIRNDAPISVLRGFRRRDWVTLAAGDDLPSPRISWRWAFRWIVVLKK